MGNNLEFRRADFGAEQLLLFACRCAAAGFVVFFVALGSAVEFRSAFMKRRMTDFGVYARAAWAVQTGADLYDIVDDNHWHYCYPPTFAVVMRPLADPPRDADRTGFLPFPVSVGIWYAFGVASLLYGVHVLANAIEKEILRPHAGARGNFAVRWWVLRLTPIAVCLPAIGNTFSRGQVGTLWLALLSCCLACIIERRRFASGVWLAGAVSLKVIPAFLFTIVAARRDARMACGIVVGAVGMLIVVPTAIWGPTQTQRLYGDFVSGVLAPGLGSGKDASRTAELTGVLSTRSQAPTAFIHHLRHWTTPRNERPLQADAVSRVGHWAIVAFVSLPPLWWLAQRPNRSKESRTPANAASVLLASSWVIVAMIYASPVCHPHYCVLCIPLVTALTTVVWFGPTTTACRKRRFLIAAAVFWIAQFAILLPNSEPLQDAGFGFWGTIPLLLLARSCLDDLARSALEIEKTEPVRRAA